jgi:hypothetical protein
MGDGVTFGCGVKVLLGTVTLPAAGSTAASGEIEVSALDGPLGTETVEFDPGFIAATGVILGGGVPGPGAVAGLVSDLVRLVAEASFALSAADADAVLVLVVVLLPAAEAVGALKSVARSPNITKATTDTAWRPPAILFICNPPTTCNTGLCGT